MAEVFPIIKGVPLHDWLAHRRDVGKALTDHARPMVTRAKALLREHKHDGHAFIEFEIADVDRHIILNDTRGLKAAMSIEYGRAGDENGKGAMEGLYILHRATHYPIRRRKR